MLVKLQTALPHACVLTCCEHLTVCRADGAGTSYDLPWTRGWAGVSDGFTPTVEPIKEFGVYKMKPYGKAEGCAAWACDQFKGMFVYSFKWKLPAGKDESAFGAEQHSTVRCSGCTVLYCRTEQVAQLSAMRIEALVSRH